MKKSTFMLLLVISCFTNVFSSKLNSDSLFNSANKAYIDKKYNESTNSYEILINKGFRSTELFYNAGNAYFKTGNYAKAILNYERAKLIDPTNSDIDFNLTKTRTYVIDKIETIPDFFIKAWLKNALSVLSPNIWAIISLLSFVVFILLYLFYLLAGKANIKRLSFYLGLLLLIVSILTLTFSFKTRKYIEKSDSAIIMSPTVTVKSSPDLESTDIFIIHEGTKVYIIRLLGNWTEIKLTDGKQGWLESSTIEKI
jgi:tetratricopeptide (TPR) repeat protein